MHQDNKVLITAVIILGIGLISFNFGTISGKVGAGNVECQPISVQAEKNGPYINMRIYIPPNRAGTNYNGIDPQHQDIRISGPSGEKIADSRIPKEALYSGETPMKFKIRALDISTGNAAAFDKCKKIWIGDNF